MHKRSYAYIADSPSFTWLLKKYSHLKDFLQSGHLKNVCLLFLVNTPSLATTRFSHSSSMNTSLGKSSKIPMSSVPAPASSSSTITTFLEGFVRY